MCPDTDSPWTLLDVEPIWPDDPPCGLAEGCSAPSVRAVLPTADAPTAAVVICPGGGYEDLAPHESEVIGEWLAGLGIAGVVLRYRVAPHRHPAPLADVLRAIRLTRARAGAWNIDPQRVGVLGFSAGGHLAASAATLFASHVPRVDDEIDTHVCRPDVAVLCYPVISFGPIGHEGSVRNLLGEDASAEQREALSLDRHISAATPPTFLWHTADDAVVDVRNSLSFAAACREKQVAAELHVFPSGHHGLGLAREHAAAGQWTGLCAAWLARQGFANASV